MMGSFLSRTLIMVFGYAYPAYECFKTVEKTKPEIHQLLYWCHYWILVAILTICERLGDSLIPWLPMYNEAKLAFFIYLWHHKTRGTQYVYDCFFRPIVKKHETEIDNSLLELRVRGGEIAVLCWEKASTYGHRKFSEILEYASSQSVPRLKSRQEPEAINDKHSVSEPISQQEPSTQLEKLPPKENGNSDGEYVQTKRSRWRFFKS
ncbi:putative HVA22-like protein g [Euphorbia lathyris]|uniref:putative HVA22-like protein g n=1 Tax=Euphorbia lathyris TaxID=212925 RepID=UPI003313B322